MSAAERQTEAREGGVAIRAEGLTVSYGPKIIQRDLNFSVRRGDVFVIMGGSGCGKSSLMRVLMGLLPPGSWACAVRRGRLLGRGLRASGGDHAPGGSAVPERSLVVIPHAGGKCHPAAGILHALPPRARRSIASLKLAQVGLAGFEDYYPSEISGGMKKRAGLARALALDPEIVFFDEPSAGLDPLSAAQLDELILELRDSMGMTVIMVTHELPSIFAVADDAVFLDAKLRTLTAQGSPRELLRRGPAEVARFLRRGKGAEDETTEDAGGDAPDGVRAKRAPGAAI